MNFLFLSAILAIIIYLIFKRNEKYSPSKINSKIPGPIGLPIFGNILSLDNKNGIHTTFQKWFKEYGPIYTINMGNKSAVVLTGFPMIKKAFIDNSEAFAPHYTFESRYKLNKCSDITQENGKNQSALKRIFLSEMTVTRIKKQESHIQNEIVKLMKVLDKHSEDGKPFLLNNYFSMFSINIISRFLFGIDFPYQDFEETSDLMIGIRDLLIASGEIVLSDFLPIPHSKRSKLYTSYQALVVQIENLVKNHKYKEGDECMLSKLMIEHDKGNIPWDAVISNCNTIITAGSDSTSSTALFFLLEMMNNPTIQTKVYNDIVNSFEQNQQPDDYMNQDMVILKYSKYRSLIPYLSLALKENYRKHPAAPFGAPHETTQETIIDGYTIAKGTMIFQNIYATQRSDTFYSQPDKFIPERWNGIENSQTLISFGTGIRDCIGKSLAYNEIFTIIASVLKRYEFINPNPSIPFDDNGIPGLTTQCKNTVVQIKKR
ncbi:hypothetical protein ACTFIY_008416 [Dictyostelium cf. discoideum]